MLSVTCLPPPQRLPPLLLLRLSILERKPTRPLIRTRLPANPTIAARKQNAPERHGREERAAQGAEAEAHDAGLRPHGVAVEGVDGVEDCGDGESRECVGGFGIGDLGRGA